MFNWIRLQVLHFMRVPHDPEPPYGAPGSIRIFRAGRNYYKLRLFRWCVGQCGALAGILVSLMFLSWFKHDIEESRLAREQSVAAATPIPEKTAGPKKKNKQLTRNDLRALAARTPEWVVIFVEILELSGIVLFLAQIPVTFVAVRLEFEMHWYIVTDRSLRIRTGLFKLTESTMSFANLQQVEVKQGPLQRLLGLADVHVQSAGGGGEHASPGHAHESLHSGIFHCVDNAIEIRDLILERLRQFRQTGLGDPDDRHDHAFAGVVPPPFDRSAANPDTLAAAREVLAEARALRASLS